MNQKQKGFFKLAVIFTFTVQLFSQAALAFPLTSTRPWQSNEVRLFFEPGFHVDGIVALSNCSASLVHFKGASLDSPAVALTNGHCAGGGIFGGGMLQPGEVYYQKAKNFSLSLLDKNANRIGSLSSRKIIYATMTDTDVTLLELTQTYRQIKDAFGVTALEMADTAPAAGTAIEISSGYWKRTYLCQIEATVNELRESNWVFKNSLRYSPVGCEVIGGTSGSPILSAATGEVIAINNTGNESGQSCTLNNPCEIDAAGNKTVLRGRGYGQQTYNLYSCLTAQGTFDLSVSGCLLPKVK